MNPEQNGTKVAAHYRADRAARRVPGDPAAAVRRGAGRLARATAQEPPVRQHFDDVLQARRKEADEFYAAVIPASLDADAANVMRQALAGMLWSKQFYHYDVDKWLEERGSDPVQGQRARRRRATTTGTTCTTATSSRCRTSGSIPGTRPGTWPSTCSP